MTITAPPESSLDAGTVVTERILTDIRRIEADLVARIPEFDLERRIPADIIETLREIGVFDLLTPASHGGLEAGLLNSVRVLEQLARIDASLAWTTMIGLESPQILSLLPSETYDELFLAERRPLFGGTFLPAGRARKVDGGYRVSGRWGFSSGCQNWDLLFGNCAVVDEDGQLLPGRIPETSLTRAMVFSATEATIEDTWRTLGMRGSGSHHFTVDDVFVPDGLSFDIMFDRPHVDGVSKFPIADFNTHIVAVILGTARGALEEFRAAATSKMRMSNKVPAALNPIVQHRIGRVEASLRAAQAYLYQVATWIEGLTGDEKFAEIGINHTGPHNAWIAQTAAEAVDEIWALSGSAEAYEGSSIQRRFRDISVSRQHASVADTAFAQLGASLFGQVYEVRQQTQNVSAK